MATLRKRIGKRGHRWEVPIRIGYTPTPTRTFAKESDESKYKIQFSKYLKEGLNPEDLPNQFEEIKKKIVGK